MTTASRLAGLIQEIAAEQDSERALDLISEALLELTPSRHAVIALMNDEEGVLELKHGAGEGFEERAKNARLQVEIGIGIIAYVAATGESLLSGNVAEEPRYEKRFHTTASEIAVPIHDAFGRIRGVVNVEADKIDAYSDEDRITTEAAASLSCMVLGRQVQERREQALLLIGSALDSALTEEALLQQVMDVAQDVLRFQACSLFLFDERTERFVLRGSTSHLREKLGEISYARGEGCTGWVCEHGEPMLLQHPQEDLRWRGRYLEFPGEEIASFLAVPILYRGRPIGAIRALRRRPENKYLDVRFTVDDQEVLQAIAEQLATGLSNIRSLEKIIRSERMIAWGELSAKSSHMIGNRVFALKGDVNELGFLVKADPLDRKGIDSLQKSLAINVHRIEEILQEFRDFVSATQLNRESGDVNTLVRETVEEFFPKRGNLRVHLDLEEELPPISVDVAKIRRALGELIENSIHHMERGVLHIRTRMDRRKKGGSWVQIEVEDEGPGVEESMKHRIFQPFFSGRVKGMGLGLSIVKGIVDAHGGQVFEVGSEGSGAKFVILLPAQVRP